MKGGIIGHEGRNPRPRWEEPSATMGGTLGHEGRNPRPRWEEPSATPYLHTSSFGQPTKAEFKALVRDRLSSEKFLKPLGTSALPSCGPIEMSAGLSARSAPRSPSGQGIRLESGRSGVRILLALWGFFQVESYQRLKTWHSVATLLGTWCYRVNTGAGQPGVSIL